MVTSNLPSDEMRLKIPPLKLFTVKGGCYCGNIKLNVGLTRDPSTYAPRLCDCTFCKKHAAGFLSDPQGTLHINVMDEAKLTRFKQEKDGNAEFLVCKDCGVLTSVVFQTLSSEATTTEGVSGTVIGAINSRSIDDFETMFPLPPVSVSPRLLSASEKIDRWSANWFGNVTFESAKPDSMSDSTLPTNVW